MHQDLTPAPPQHTEEVISGYVQRLFIALFFSSSEPDTPWVTVAAGSGFLGWRQETLPTKLLQSKFPSVSASADSNLHVFCITHLPTAHPLLQLQVSAGQSPALGPGTRAALRKGVHAAAEQWSALCERNAAAVSSAKVANKPCLDFAGGLQGVGVQLRVLSHPAQRSRKWWMSTEICLAGASIPAPKPRWGGDQQDQEMSCNLVGLTRRYK